LFFGRHQISCAPAAGRTNSHPSRRSLRTRPRYVMRTPGPAPATASGRWSICGAAGRPSLAWRRSGIGRPWGPDARPPGSNQPGRSSRAACHSGPGTGRPPVLRSGWVEYSVVWALLHQAFIFETNDTDSFFQFAISHYDTHGGSPEQACSDPNGTARFPECVNLDHATHYVAVNPVYCNDPFADVDADDFAVFEACASGPAIPANLECDG